jgi:hypothetical protein
VLHFQTGSAPLLPNVIDGRTSGPLADFDSFGNVEVDGALIELPGLASSNMSLAESSYGAGPTGWRWRVRSLSCRPHVAPRVPAHRPSAGPGDPAGRGAALGGLPGVAQVAIQGGRHVARQIVARLAGKSDGARLAGSPDGQPIENHDKGSMATISRFSALASIGGFRLSGFTAWVVAGPPTASGSRTG